MEFAGDASWIEIYLSASDTFADKSETLIIRGPYQTNFFTHKKLNDWILLVGWITHALRYYGTFYLNKGTSLFRIVSKTFRNSTCNSTSSVTDITAKNRIQSYKLTWCCKCGKYIITPSQLFNFYVRVFWFLTLTYTTNVKLEKNPSLFCYLL